MSGSTASHPPKAANRGRNRREVRPARALLAPLFALLVCVPGCAALESSTAQPPPEGPLIVGFIDVGQGDEVFRNDEHGVVVVTIRDDSVENAATTKGG